MQNLESRSHDLFIQLIEKSPAEWPAYLDLNCETPELREMVQRLLDMHVRSNDFLTKPAALTYPSLASSVDEMIAEFRIIRQLGRGGMGLVYLTEDTKLKRLVALKTVRLAHNEDNEVLASFHREARAAARLSHPGIVKVYRDGEDQGVHYIAMEYVDGSTLQDRMETDKQANAGTTSRDRYASIAKLVFQIADALEHAHRASVIHRDIKPSNILIDATGNARLTDFGIARIVTEQTLLPAGSVIGSCAYMSPEQARVSSVEVDHRTDIFSLGIVLYEAISFRRPFDGSTQNEVFRSLAEGRPTFLKKICPSVPFDLAVICHKSIERDVTHRYQTAAHMSADLRCFLEGRHILARPPSLTRRTIAWILDNRQSLLVTGIISLAIIAVGLGYLFMSSGRAAMGHLVVDDAHHGAVVMAIPYSDELVQGQPIPLGRAPVSTYLKPGLYRVTIDDGRLPVSTSSLLEPGQTDTIKVNKPTPPVLETLVKIEGGNYGIGNPDNEYRLSMPRQVRIPSFLISRTEVSNGQYRQYVLDTNGRAPSNWPVPYDTAIDDLPVTDVSWDEALDYCRWLGVRLPTPDEWEIAAQEPQLPADRELISKKYLRIEVERLNAEVYRQLARPVDSDPELATPRGLKHMMSNVQEYTAGIAVDRNNGVVVKGRSWNDSPFRTPAEAMILSSRSVRSYNRGFRIALDLIEMRNDYEKKDDHSSNF